MGFRNFQEFNMALIAKQCWPFIHEPNSLWVKIKELQIGDPQSNDRLIWPMEKKRKKYDEIWLSLDTL
ncbi:hypothetical protein DVH24_004831 [Malus domestica]|uniref:Uncharacterized protein n=1 Tax=Malus domestica TaxID=3750 RepID=A0A498IG15_MALDO|nr:hypothetical protein DVH24_004831 [Malus domestica]